MAFDYAYQIASSGGRVYYKDIPPGEEVDQGTYHGHYWIILDKNKKPLGIYKSPGEDGIIIIEIDVVGESYLCLKRLSIRRLCD